MPSCEGPPSGTCQNKSKRKEVKYGQGELWLCEECEEIRFGHLNRGSTRRVSTKNPKKSSAGRKSTNPTASGSNHGSLHNTRNRNTETAQNDLGTVNCKVCENILVVDDDDSVSCDRCEQLLCIDCSRLTKSDIEHLAQSHGNMFWYCTTCKDSAVSAVKADKVVEEKCKEFLESFEKSLREEAEHTIKTTCDKYMLTITKRLEAVEQKLNSTAEARQSSSTTMGTLQANEREGQAIDCLQDRMARKNNVVFFGVSEAEGSTREDKMADNKAKIVSIASEIGVQLKDEDILSFKRLGKMGQTRMVKDEEVSLPRLLLVTLTEAAKAALMKNAYKLQFSTSEMKEIRIKHDMSKEDRQREYELRQEARQKQMDNTDQDFLYRVRGPNWDRKIVKIRKFVSKVAKEAKEVPPATDKETENQD